MLGVTLGGNLLWTAIAVVLGCALGTFFMAFHSTQGPQLGLPQMIQSRPQFGYAGALLVWVVALIAYIGYNAFNQVLCAQSLHQLTPAIAPDSSTAIMLFALLAGPLAAVGYDKIHLAQRGFAYLMIAILTVFTLGAPFVLEISGLGISDPADFRAVPFLAELFAAASYQLSWSIYVSDYSRYLPRDVGTRESFWWTYLGAFIGGTWMMLVGTVAAASDPKLDIAAAMKAAADHIAPGFGDMLLVGSLLGTGHDLGAELLRRLADAAERGRYFEAAALHGGQAPRQRGARQRLPPRRWRWSHRRISSAASATSCRCCSICSRPGRPSTWWTSTGCASATTRSGRFSIREGMYGRWNWRGLLAYGVGFVAMIPFFSTGTFTGPVARALGGADVAMLVGLPVAALVYLLCCRSMDLERDRDLAFSADIGLDP